MAIDYSQIQSKFGDSLENYVNFASYCRWYPDKFLDLTMTTKLENAYRALEQLQIQGVDNAVLLGFIGKMLREVLEEMHVTPPKEG